MAKQRFLYFHHLIHILLCYIVAITFLFSTPSLIKRDSSWTWSVFGSVFTRRFTHFIGLFSRNLTDLTWDSKFVWLKFRMNFREDSFTRLHSPRLKSETFCDISLHLIFESESLGFIFSTRNSLTCRLHIFSRPQVIENSRQYLLLRTDILQKTVVGCPWYFKDGSFKKECHALCASWEEESQ